MANKIITKQGLTSKDIADFYLLLTQANDDQLEQLSYKIGQEIRKRHTIVVYDEAKDISKDEDIERINRLAKNIEDIYKSRHGKSTLALGIFNELKKRGLK